MKKKIFFVAGVAVSAFAVSCFIPLADGQYWWSALTEPRVTVVEMGDRLPAGTDAGTPIDPGAYDPTIPPEEPYQEPPPTYSDSGEKGAPAPAYPTPAPAPAPTPTGNCLTRAFGGEAASGIQFSSSYINSYINAAIQTYNLGVTVRGTPNSCGTNCKRLAIMGIMTAGYCAPVDRYQRGYESSTVLPRNGLTQLWTNYSLAERKSAWDRNQAGRNPLYCRTDAFGDAAKRARICVNAYRVCGMGSYVDRDCRGITPDHDDDDNGGGASTGGSTTGGDREVGPGTNNDAGHGGDRGGSHGDGPPGSGGETSP